MAALHKADQAIIELRKLSDYLLNQNHPQGGGKAKFLARFGFTLERPEVLRAALLAHAINHDVSSCHTTAFGTMLEVEGELDTPSGRRPLIRTV